MKSARPLIVILAVLLAGQIGAASLRAIAHSPAVSNFARPATAKSRPKPAALVDVNHATVDELKTLPGISDAFAAKIVKNRPYANKTQLSSKGVLSPATYAKIRAYIIAKQ